jgi:hypothetical protein
MSTSSTVSWPPGAPLWTFSWEVIDGDGEGVVFRNVFYKGKKVLYKASLPMIRVQYDYGAGPYKDQLSGTNMQGPVQVYEETGHNFLVVEEMNFRDPCFGHRLVDLRFGPAHRRVPVAFAIVDLTNRDVIKTGLLPEEAPS